MFTNSILAVSGALLSVVAAVPMAGEHHQHHQHHARDYVWETKVQEVVVTVPVTKTVWVEPGEAVPTHHEKAGPPPAYGQSSSASTTAPAAPAYTPKSSSSAPAAPAYTPQPSSSSKAPVAPAYTPPASTSTSVDVAPTPSTTAPAAPAYTAPSSSAPAAPAYTAPASGSGSGSSGSNGLTGMAASGTEYMGDLTYYAVGLGACGLTSTEQEHIVAISEKIFDSYNNGNPNNNPLCGKYITITGKNGEEYQAKIVDRCPGCDEGSLDLPQNFFNMCTSNGDGRVSGMKWKFN
ncbi:Allergen Asp f 7 [Fulvia fulva]|nr:Allergen Asp f 7 [Fulvia fulva]KAK4610789.1 Allergen Asp f 7 [Fulvia fulva]WPV22213.1 Allergen Asp f 7 [Fulvia fulva]